MAAQDPAPGLDRPERRGDPPVPTRPQPPPTLPDYELIRCIGAGSYGDVWLARNVLGRFDAVKVVYRERFDHARPYEREFEGIRHYEPASRKHPSQVALLHVGRDPEDRYYYYAMELADDLERGQDIQPELYHPRTLETELRERGRLPVGECVALGLALARALQDLHAEGLIHRDIKPANIIWVRGQPKLADLGLVAEQDQTMTLVGTRGYLPPEGPGSVAADLYSLGKVLYECSTGRDREEFPHLPAALADPTDQAPLLEFNEVVLKACDNLPRRRYRDARELQEDLHLIEAGRSLRRTRALERRLNRLARVSAAVTLLALLATGAYGLQKRQTAAAQHSRQRAERALAHTQLQQAQALFASEQTPAALAILARLLRANPQDPMLAERIRFALSQRHHPVPVLRLPHAQPLTVARWAPDALRVLTAAEDGTACVWNARTGERVGSPMPHPHPVHLAEFSPGGQRIVTAADRWVRVWDAETSQPATDGFDLGQPARGLFFSPDESRLLVRFRASARILDARSGRWLSKPVPHAAETGAVDFSPAGDRIATAPDPRTVAVWDGREGARLFTLNHPGLVHLVRFSPDGRLLLTGSAIRTTRLWDARTGRLVADLVGHEFPVITAAFTPDGSRVVTGSRDRTVRIWEVPTGRCLVGPIEHGAIVGQVGFSRDGRQVLSGSSDGAWRVRDAVDGTPTSEGRYSDRGFRGCALSPDGDRVLLAPRNERAAWLLDLRPGRFQPRVLPHRDFVVFARFDGEGARLLTITDWEISTIGEHRTTRTVEPFPPEPIVRGAARVWDVATGRALTPPLEHDDGLLCAAFSPDGSRLATGSRDHVARVWDAGTGELLLRLPHESRRGVRSVLFSPDGRRLFTSAWLEDGAWWAVDQGALLRRFGDRHLQEPGSPFMPIRTADMTRDGRYVVTGSRDGARVWNVASGEPLPYVFAAGQNVRAARFSPRGDRLVTAARRETGDSPSCAQVWEVATGEAITRFLLHNSTVRFAEFSPDGTRIVTASLDRTARIWDARTGGQLTPPLAHKGEVMHAEFSPEGERVITASWWDRAALLWDARTGLPLGDPLRHDDWVTFAAFSPDGRRVVTTSCDGTAKIWELPTASPPVPAWLADLAEAVGGQRLDDQGIPQGVPLDALWTLRGQLLASPETDPCTRWARRFFADRTTRVPAPEPFPRSEK